MLFIPQSCKRYHRKLPRPNSFDHHASESDVVSLQQRRIPLPASQYLHLGYYTRDCKISGTDPAAAVSRAFKTSYRPCPILWIPTPALSFSAVMRPSSSWSRQILIRSSTRYQSCQVNPESLQHDWRSELLRRQLSWFVIYSIWLWRDTW